MAKLFMPPLGTRKGDVKDALSTDLGGLMNLLEWCPFIAPPVNRGVVIDVRENVRNLWAHAPNHEISNIEKTAAEGYLRDLLNDPVFAGDRVVQNGLNELRGLSRNGVASVRETELEVLIQLRNALNVDLEALLEAGKLGEKVETVQEDVKDITRDFMSLRIESQERNNKVKTLRREIEDVNSFISSSNSRVQQVGFHGNLSPALDCKQLVCVQFERY